MWVEWETIQLAWEAVHYQRLISRTDNKVWFTFKTSLHRIRDNSPIIFGFKKSIFGDMLSFVEANYVHKQRHAQFTFEYPSDCATEIANALGGVSVDCQSVPRKVIFAKRTFYKLVDAPDDGGLHKLQLFYPMPTRPDCFAIFQSIPAFKTAIESVHPSVTEKLSLVTAIITDSTRILRRDPKTTSFFKIDNDFNQVCSKRESSVYSKTNGRSTKRIRRGNDENESDDGDENQNDDGDCEGGPEVSNVHDVYINFTFYL